MTDYSSPLTGAAQDETLELRPKFNADGLVAAIAQDATSADALAATLATRRATYWSRSRGALWVKGETSGHTQAVVEVRVDCDQDVVLLRVNQTGGACHTGRDSCFFRVAGQDGRTLSMDIDSN